jgi:hypothetical protein
MKNAPIASAERENEDPLFNLAAHMESDGGMPGKDSEERILSTLLALLSFVEKGHTSQIGAFRVHVQRLISFLESSRAKSLSPERQSLIGKIVKFASSGKVVTGDWCREATKALKGTGAKDRWTKIEAEFQNVN